MHLGYLFGEVPFLERFQAAADCGFAAVEFSDPLRFPPAQLAQRIRNAGLSAVQITTSSFNTTERKQVGLAAVPGREHEFQRDCRALVPYVQGLSVRWVHVMAGVVDPGDSFVRCYRTYLDNVRFALRTFEPYSVGVLIEPINTIDVPGYFVGTIDVARRAIADLGGRNAALMFDAYHIAMDGRDPERTLRDCFPAVGHIQIADAPGRNEPLSGAIDFERLFAAIDDLGYDGWISCEYFPVGETRAGLGWRNKVRCERAALVS